MGNINDPDYYLIHYGIKRRSGRYPFGSGSRPFQSVKGTIAKRRTPEAKASRINKRATKKLEKLEMKRSSAQEQANKMFDKATKKANSFFSSQKKVNKALDRANASQKVVNRLEYKGQNYYKKVQKKLSKIDGEVDPKVQKLGEQYIKSMANNSKSIYNAMLTSQNAGIQYTRRRR